MPDPLYSGRYTQGYAITPSDTAPVVTPTGEAATRAILCVVAGNVTARFRDSKGSSISFPVLAGVVYPFALNFVHTATTATIIGLN